MEQPSPKIHVRRIVSGGQTGVDRGALDAAIALGIDHGGWCPRGRIAEDGVIPERYRLQETESAEYPVRTERNVLESDGTLILYRRQLRGGTRLTHRLAAKHGKPMFLYDLDAARDLTTVRQWLATQHIQTLNVAGPREDETASFSRAARDTITKLLGRDAA